MYRSLTSSLVTFLLAHWGNLSLDTQQLLDWGVDATLVLKTCLVEVVVTLFLAEIEQKQTLLRKQGLDVYTTRCNI